MMIDDEIVTDFTRIPEEKNHVYIKLVPEGDSNEDAGKGMKVGGTLSVIAGITTIAFLGWTGLGGLLGAAFIGAGLACFAGGAVLCNINVEIPSVGKTKQEAPEQDPSIRGSENQMRPYGVIPTLFGKRRIYADLAAKSYTWSENDSVYLYQLFCAGQKDMTIDTSTIRIDETLLKDYSSSKNINTILSGNDPLIDMRIHQDGTMPVLYERCVHEEQVNAILRHETEEGIDGSVIRTLPDGTRSINVDVFFYNGLGQYNDDGSIGEASVMLGAWYKKADENDSRYRCLGSFSSATDEGIISGSELKTKRCSLTLNGLEAASYTVKISRITMDSTDAKVIDDVYVGSIRASKLINPVRPERASQLTLIELKIKASEKLQNVVKQLNFVAQSKMPSYTGNGTGRAQWSDAVSSNPASAAIYAMQGEFAQQKLSDCEIDWHAFERLYKWCASHKYECNAYLAESLPISSLLSSIASTCRAEIFRLNGKITVIQDIERDSFTQLFTPRNSHDYSEHIALSDIPDALNITFVDEKRGYAENFTRVYNTPKGKYESEPETTQEVPLWGVTDDTQARKIGMYNYAVMKNRFIIHKFSCDFEYLMCTKGDWIKYAGDIALAGITQGRIAEIVRDRNGYAVRFECDEEIPMKSGKKYGMRVRKADGNTAIYYLENIGTVSKTVTLSSAITDESAPDEGDLFTFGEISGTNLNDAIDLIITDIQCGENLSADLTCVEYAPEIFGVDEPNFKLPEFKNNLSEIAGEIDAGAVSGWRTWTTFNDSDNTPSRPSGDGTSNGWHYAQTTESKWISTKTAETVSSGEWSAPIPTGQMAIEHILDGDTNVGNPDTVTGVFATARQSDIIISWNPVTENGLKNTVKQYSVEISKDNGTTWNHLVDVYDSSAIYYFNRATNADGYPEKAALLLWKFRVTTVNVYGKTAAVSTAVNTDVSDYLTWIPPKPTATITAQEKGLRLLLEAPNMTSIYGTLWFHVTISDGKGASYNFTVQDLDSTLECYGNNFFEREDFSAFSVTIWGCNEAYNAERGLNDRAKSVYAGNKINVSFYKGWKPANPVVSFSGQGRHLSVAISNEERYGELVTEVQVSKDNKTWYEPDLTSDPYASADNWKKNQNKAFNVLGESFYQKLPLETDTKSNTVKDTTYYYRFRTVNVTAKKQSNGYAAFPFIAQGTGARDVVKNAINTAHIVDGAITALKIYVENLAAITANLGVITNGTLKSNATNMWDLGTGEFRVGNNAGDYFRCIPYKGNNGTIAYNISFKASKFELTAIGTVVRGAFYACPKNATVDANGVPSSYYFCVTDSGVTFNKNVTVNGSIATTGNASANGNITAGALLQGRGLKKTWTTLDLSALNSSLWYPVTFTLGVEAFTEVECYVSLNSGTKPSWSTHASGFTCHLHLLTIGSGRGTTVSQTVVLDHQYSYATINPTGWSQMSNSSTGVLWLRGGGKYFAWNSKNAAFTIRQSTYTVSNQSVAPTSSAQWSLSRATVTANLDGNAATSSSCSGNAATATTAVCAAKLGRNGAASAPMTFNWSGKDGQPSWLWGGDDGSNMYVYNPRNFSVASALSAQYGLAYCETAAATSAKTARLPGFSLTEDTRILMYNVNQNTVNSVTLNVNNTGAKPMNMLGTVPGLVMLHYKNNYWDAQPILNLSKTSLFNVSSKDNSIGSEFDGGALGVRAWRFTSTYGYIMFTNGLLIQWGVIPSGRIDTEIKLIAYSSGTSYAISTSGTSSSNAYFYSATKTGFWANIANFTNEIRWITIGF